MMTLLLAVGCCFLPCRPMASRTYGRGTGGLLSLPPPVRLGRDAQAQWQRPIAAINVPVGLTASLTAQSQAHSDRLLSSLPPLFHYLSHGFPASLHRRDSQVAPATWHLLAATASHPPPAVCLCLGLNRMHVGPHPCCSDPAINRMVPSSQWKMTRPSDVVRDEPIYCLIREI